MKLAKLKIKREGENRLIEVLYNPQEISLDQEAGWKVHRRGEGREPRVQSTSGDAATLAFSLFFDTSEARSDVREHTRRVADLARVDVERHRPPTCQLLWKGIEQPLSRRWALTRVQQKFTHFLADGTPVRAELSCSFTELSRADLSGMGVTEPPVHGPALESEDLEKTFTVRRGDTLAAIAAIVYRDPTSWRPIADANRLADPRRLEPGAVLRIPKLVDRRPGAR